MSVKPDHVRAGDVVCLADGPGELLTAELVQGSVVVCTRIDHTGQVVRGTFHAGHLLVVYRPVGTGR